MPRQEVIQFGRHPIILALPAVDAGQNELWVGDVSGVDVLGLLEIAQRVSRPFGARPPVIFQRLPIAALEKQCPAQVDERRIGLRVLLESGAKVAFGKLVAAASSDGSNGIVALTRPPESASVGPTATVR